MSSLLHTIKVLGIVIGLFVLSGVITILVLCATPIVYMWTIGVTLYYVVILFFDEEKS
ncbi:MAG: hypothetical protein U9O94_06345 [Nanoarchaeota archaeon]|nr:hypothetical protein [Nanoarchaeota archaeon]